MYIKEFVKESLSQITEGIREVEPDWETIDPKSTGFTRPHKLTRTGPSSVTVDFDIAVTIEDASEGKGGLHVWFVEGGASIETRNTSLNRVKFQVEIDYP